MTQFLTSLIGMGMGALNTNAANRNAGKAAWQQFLNNVYLQQNAQNWSEYMSNTSHQREVADLVKAGINPLYTVDGGNGANAYSATPAAANAAQTFMNSETGANLLNATANANSSKSVIELNKKSEKKIDAETENIKQDTINKETSAQNIRLDNDLKDLDIKNYDKKLNAYLNQAKSVIAANNASSAKSFSEVEKNYKEQQLIEQTINTEQLKQENIDKMIEKGQAEIENINADTEIKKLSAKWYNPKEYMNAAKWVAGIIGAAAVLYITKNNPKLIIDTYKAMQTGNTQKLIQQIKFMNSLKGGK